MKKIVPFILTLLSALVFWVVEPYGNNPLYQPSLPSAKSSLDFNCATDLQDIRDKANSVLDKHMLSGDFLGVSTGFFKENCGSLTVSSGYRDKRNQVEFKPNTITRIASITKTMTAVAIMQLYEKGEIDLDAPIQAYLPTFPRGTNPVTIRHILNHTSGIPHYESKFDAMSFSHYASLKLATEEVYKRGLINSPGEKYVYSSFGYTILGSVIEQVTKENFEDYLRKNIWQKSGMKNTSLEKSHLQKNKSRLYIKVGGIFIRSPYTDLSIIYPAGGVQSTVQDLLKFGKAILENQLISRKTLEIMIDASDSLAPETGDDPYGLGWSVFEHPEYGKIISHGGAQPGASAQFQILLDKNVVSVALSNAFGTKNSIRNLAFSMGKLGVSIQAHNNHIQPTAKAVAD
ncbi:MAG: serine beta-lactamase-like protein LACTB [Candidatus Latescibacterota bacterium]